MLGNVTLLSKLNEIDHWDNRPFTCTLPHQLAKGTDSRKSIRKKPKRVRTAFSAEQLLVLEETFKTERYIRREQRSRLSNLLVLRERQIKIWFQNRRMKQKRNNTENYASDVGSVKSEPGSPDSAAEFTPMKNEHLTNAFEELHNVPYMLPDALASNKIQGQTLQNFGSAESSAPVTYNNWQNVGVQGIMNPISGGTAFKNYYQELSAMPAYGEDQQYWCYNQYQQSTLQYPQFAHDYYWGQAGEGGNFQNNK